MSLVSLSILTLVSFVGAQSQNDLVDRCLISRGKAYFVGYPTLVSDDAVREFEVSPDGSFILMSCWGTGNEKIDQIAMRVLTGKPEAPKIVWKSYDCRRDKLQIIPGFEGVDIQNDLWWTSVSGIAIARLPSTSLEGESLSNYVKVSMTDNKVTPYLSHRPGLSEAGFMTVSPKRPFTVLVSQTRKQDPASQSESTVVDWQLLDLNGQTIRKFSQTIRRPVIFQELWSKDGEAICGWVKGDSERTIGGKPEFVLLHPENGTLTFTFARPFGSREEERSNTFSVQTGLFHESKSGGTELPVGWLMPIQPEDGHRVLITSSLSDAEAIRLSGDEKRVVYLANGSLFQCQIYPFDMEKYVLLKELRQRSLDMMASKQVATAALILAADRDDKLPAQNLFRDMVRPYLKDEKMLDKFVYTFKGGNLSDLKDPAGTELGYVTTKGGRCVAYADGHVKLVKD